MSKLFRSILAISLICILMVLSCNQAYAKIQLNEKVVNQNIDWTKYFDWENELDTGIYWFDENGQPYKDGSDNLPFDKNKKTMIYVHGWQKDSSKKYFRENFFLEEENSAKKWIENGWNIGIFYWNQLADESELKDAEKKIWVADNMRWKKPDGTYVTDKNKIPNKSTAEIFYNSYIQAMKNYKGKDIRISGHSLGNQMATRLVKLVSDNIDNKNIDKNLMPKRLVLLDPFWSRWKKDYLNDKWTGEVCREYIKDLVKKDLIVEMYKSSILTGFLAGDENTPLKKLVCYTELKPLYANSWNLSKKHHAAVNYYLLSIGLLNNYPQEMVNNKISNIKAPSASTSNEITKSRMGNGNWWKQQSNDGAYTIPSIDDVFERIQW